MPASLLILCVPACPTLLQPLIKCFDIVSIYPERYFKIFIALSFEMDISISFAQKCVKKISRYGKGKSDLCLGETSKRLIAIKSCPSMTYNQQ